MPRAIFKVQIKDHEKTNFFVILQVIKASPSLGGNLTVAEHKVNSPFFSKDTAKVENFFDTAVT